MNRFLTMSSANDLFSHPLRWVGKNLALYAAAAVIAGALFVAGSALYARFVPASPSPEIHKFVPPSVPAVDVPNPTPTGEEKAPLVANGETIPIGTAVGAKVFDMNRSEIGKIEEVTLTSVGEAKVKVMKPDGKVVFLPAESFLWKSTKIKLYGGNAGTDKLYSVEAIAKKPIKQLQ